MKSIYVFLPCYNEEQNIGRLIEEWIDQNEALNQRGYTLKLRPIDDKSTDSTKAVIIDKQAKYQDIVELIAHPVNMNLCGGLNTAIQYFISHAADCDLMCLMDGDDTHHPKYSLAMLESMGNSYDCVIASRYRSGSRIVGLSIARSLISQMARLYYSLMLRVPNVRDYTCGYRIYNYTSISRLTRIYGERPIKEKTFACMMELLYKLFLTGSSFIEVGFVLRYDQKGGESKMRIAKTIKSSLLAPFKLKKEEIHA